MVVNKALVSGQDIKDFSEQIGFLSQTLFVMRSKPVHGIELVMNNLDSHLDYWKDNEEKKVLFAAGPILSKDINEAWSGEGMVIYRANTLKEAHSISEMDPMHISRARNYTIETWLLNHLEV